MKPEMSRLKPGRKRAAKKWGNWRRRPETSPAVRRTGTEKLPETVKAAIKLETLQGMGEESGEISSEKSPEKWPAPPWPAEAECGMGLAKEREHYCLLLQILKKREQVLREQVI